MNLSIIIPTIHRSHDLKNTLETLARSSVVPYDIIIIDQSDDQKTKDLVSQRSSKLSLRYFHSAVKSGAKARNFAIKQLLPETDIVVFLDDDVSLDSQCFAHMLSFVTKHDSCQGGVFAIDTPSRSISLMKKIGFFLLTGTTKFENQFVTHGGFNAMFLQNPSQAKQVERCSGCAMFFRKSVLDEGFEFPEAFMKYSLMEDVFMSYAIHKKYPDSLYYIPNAQLIHHESPNRTIPAKAKVMQNIVHRFLFVKHFELSLGLYIWTTLWLSVLDLITYKDIKITQRYISGLRFVLKNRKKLTLDASTFDYNSFIFS